MLFKQDVQYFNMLFVSQLETIGLNAKYKATF